MQRNAEICFLPRPYIAGRAYRGSLLRFTACITGKGRFLFSARKRKACRFLKTTQRNAEICFLPRPYITGRAYRGSLLRFRAYITGKGRFLFSAGKRKAFRFLKTTGRIAEVVFCPSII